MIFKRRKNKDKVDEQFIEDNARKIKPEDVEKVFEEADKITEKMEKNSKFDQLISEAKVMLGLINDYRKKEYVSIPWYAVTAIVFSLLYVLNPLDLSPDYIPFVGYLDDVTVFTFALSMVKKDLNAYKEWKAENTIED